MNIAVILVVVGSIVAIVGIIGCILPIVPGPMLVYLSVVLLYFAPDAQVVSLTLLVVLGVLSLAATLSDQLLPSVASKRAGAGRPGIVGSVVGMLVGMVFFPPFGLVIGAFLGALIGEMLFHRENEHPVRSALAVFRGTLLAAVVKLSMSAVTIYFFVRSARALFG